ncbi:MAG: hypothetical protein K6B74_00620 [Ruminococcus sp.]|nr:hypothetical protein [Ruminococcus sp.]
MKKTLALLAAVILTVAMLPGCGSKTTGEEDKTETTTTAASTASAADSSAPDTSSDSAAEIIETVDEGPLAAPVPVDVTVYDKHDINIKATEFRKNADVDNGPELGLDIENKTGKELTIYLEEASVDGWVMQVEPLIMTSEGATNFGGVFTVPAENDTNKYSIYVGDSLLQSYGLSEIQEVEFSMVIVVGDDFDHAIYTDKVSVKNPQYSGDAIPYDDSGDVAYDKDGIKIVLQGAGYDEEYFGPTVFLYAYNGTDKTIDLRISKSEVNGEEHAAYGDSTIAPGKHLGEAVPFDGLAGAAPIGTITMSFDIYEYDVNGEGKLIASTEPFTAEYEPLDVEVKALSKEELAKAKGSWSREGNFSDEDGNTLSIEFLTEAQHWTANEWYVSGNFADGSYWGGSAEITDKGLSVKKAETIKIDKEGTMSDGEPISAEVVEDGKDGVKVKFGDGKELKFTPGTPLVGDDLGWETDEEAESESKDEKKDEKKSESKDEKKAE